MFLEMEPSPTPFHKYVLRSSNTFRLTFKQAAFLAQIRDAFKRSTPHPYAQGMSFLALDPGETTGACRLQSIEGEWYFTLEQWETKDIGESSGLLDYMLKQYTTHHVRMEDYRVYAWKTDDHTWAGLHTPQLIGAFKAVCYFARVPCTMKMAVDAKTFWTDEKLRMLDLYDATKGMRHARDAFRHALTFMVQG